MATAVEMKQPQSGLIATGYYGFSWTSFFFSGIPAIMRGDLGMGLGILALSIVLGLFSMGLLGAVDNLVWAFAYNRSYTRRLIEKGYIVVDGPHAGEARLALGVG